jgi:hypothetical protein
MPKSTNNYVTGPLLKDVLDLDRTQQQALLSKFENQPEKPADLMHDDGSGYNTGFQFPQE